MRLDRRCSVWRGDPSEAVRIGRADHAPTGFDGEFVVSAADVLDMSGADHLGGAETFQAAHRPEPGFQPTVIGFGRVVAWRRRRAVRRGAAPRAPVAT